MENRIAVISIILMDSNSASVVNSILTEYGQYIIGRMGLPYKEKNVNIICVVIDASQNTINTISGKLGKINGISVKANYVHKEKNVA